MLYNKKTEPTLKKELFENPTVEFRVTVFDEKGNHADTNAFFVEEFL